MGSPRCFRRLVSWWQDHCLSQYPELAAFQREDALKRLRAYAREEHEAVSVTQTVLWIVAMTGLLACAVLSYLGRLPIGSAALLVLFQVPFFISQYAMTRRVRRRVHAKVAAELRDGRVWTCVACGYDLRATETRCPECGASVNASEGPR